MIDKTTHEQREDYLAALRKSESARGASNHDPEGTTVGRSEGAAPRATAPIAHPDECPVLIQRIASLYGVIAKETSGYVTAHIGSVPRSLVELVPARELVVEHGGGRFTWTRLVWLYGDEEPRRMMTLSTDEPPAGWVEPECCAECGAAVVEQELLCRKCQAEGPA